ncbi:MAG: GAF domain-containing protein, partial [Calditrichaeota bacterium]
MDDATLFAANPRLNRLLHSVVQEVRRFAEDQINQIQQLTRIGIALSAEKDIKKLLDLIVDQAMEFTHADAGTLYTVDTEANCLRFEILKNLSLKTHLGGKGGAEITLPPVPLEVDGRPNLSNVSSYVALKGEMVNIPDVYEAEGFDFTGPKKYDAQTGYRSRSMLVVPMKNHQNEIIGVLQLLNAQDPRTGEVIPFAPEYENLVLSLASQAAVALENAELIQSLKELFEAFIRSIATAIDEKSPYTGGHIRRVTELTMMIAQKINEATEGPFAGVHFTEDELEELRIAAWMHDVGKITTPEYVIDKSRKLETLLDGIELVKARFDLIRQLKEKAFLERKLELVQNGRADAEALRQLDASHQAELAELEEEKAFVVACNSPEEYMDEDKLKRLQAIARKTYHLDGQEHPYLTEKEVHYLSVRRGTLTEEERQIIQNHAWMSIKILEQLPFPRKLARVPEYAGGHHEKLDGSGYPRGLTGEQLPLQARIMALADIFEALTAQDRPYKAPMKLSKAVEILRSMCRANH